MFKVVSKILCLSFMTLLGSCAIAESDTQWLTDMEKAKSLAKAQNKDILVLFTGSDWCQPCMLLKKNIFTKNEFKKFVSSKFILVELDFPSDESLLSEEQKKHNDKWKEVLDITAFPSMYLVDSNASAYALLTGYDQKIDAAGYISRLSQAVESKEKTAKLFAEAESKSGLSRAEALDEILSNLSPNALVGNRKEVEEEILQLSSDNEQLLDKYGKSSENWRLKNEIQKRGLNKPNFNPEDFESDLKAKIDIFEKYKNVKGGEALHTLFGSMMSSFSMIKDLDEARNFFSKVYEDKNYSLESRSLAGLYMAHAIAGGGDVEAAVRIIDEIVVMSPESEVAKNRDRIVGDIGTMAEQK